MTTDNYTSSTSRSAYYPDGSNGIARLWATEKLLHDLAASGRESFFEGSGSDPTALTGYSPFKKWLQTSAGVTTSAGTIRAWNGSGDPSLLASWPALDLAAVNKHWPVIHPSTGNLTGQGGSPTTHQVLYSDANQIITADAKYWTSTDPSALCSIVVANEGVAGNTVSVRFRWNSGANDVTVTATVPTSPTTTTVAAAIVAAVKASDDLFVAADSFTNPLGGGLPGLVLYITNSGASVHFDYDSREDLTLSYTTSGSVSLTLPATHPTAVDKAWDSNPLWFASRFVSGMAPPANSNIFDLGVGSTRSDQTDVVGTDYGHFSMQVLSSTAGALESRWSIVLPDANGVLNKGWYLGRGIAGVGTAGGPKGDDSINAAAYYVDGRNILSRDIVLARKSASQTVSSLSAWVKITFDTETYASANFDSATNSRYTAAYSNYYEFELTADVLVGGTSASMAFSFQIGGAGAPTGPQFNVSRANGVNETFSFKSPPIFLTAGQYVEAFAYTTQSISIVGGANGTHLAIRERQ